MTDKRSAPPRPGHLRRRASDARLPRLPDGASRFPWVARLFAGAALACATLASTIVRSQAESPARQPPSAVALVGATLIDGNGGPPLENAVIILRGDKIVSVGRQGETAIPSDATVLHEDGKFIMPGLIDAHLHYSGMMAELLLNHGVTTAFDIAGFDLYQVVRRNAINQGRIKGPRLFIPVDSVLAPVQPDHFYYARAERRGAVSPSEAVRIARGAFADGADYLNIRRGLGYDAFKAAVDVAHGLGRPVVAQPIGPSVYAREAVLAGADILEHAAGVSYSIVRDPSRWRGWGEREIDSLDPRPYADMDPQKAADLIALMVARHTYLEPDMIAEGRGLHRRSKDWEVEDRALLAAPGLAYLPPGVKAKWLANYSEFKDDWPAEDMPQLKAGLANYKRFIGMFVKAGGIVLAGDDASFGGWAVPGLGIQRELQLMVEAGLTPMQALMTATRNPAQAYRVLDRLGTLEPGKLADLLVLDANPLADVRNVQKIALVIKDGKPVDRAYHADFKDSFAGDIIQQQPDWYAGLERNTREGIRTIAGLSDPDAIFGQPCPGIASLTPRIAREGGPSLAVTIKGVNFTSRSMVYWAGKPVPTTRVSPTEMHATIDRSLVKHAGIFPVLVKNPGPNLSQPKWGDTSNPGFFIVDMNGGQE